MKTPRPIEGLNRLPTLAYMLAPVDGDDAELYIGIRPIGQTAREIGHHDDLLGEYWVSLVEREKVKLYRLVDLFEEYDPGEGEYANVEVAEHFATQTAVSTKVTIPGLTPEKAAQHHAKEWSEHRRAENPVGEIFARHRARLAYAVANRFPARAYTAVLSDAMKKTGPE